MKSINKILSAALVSLTLFSCSKDDISETASFEPDQFMAQSEQARVCSGTWVKPVNINMYPPSLQERDIVRGRYRLRYFGYPSHKVELFTYANASTDDKTRYKLKEDYKDDEPENVVVQFARIGGNTLSYRAYLAPYGQTSNGTNKFSFSLLDTEEDNLIYKQHPLWGSCSGAIFSKDITKSLFPNYVPPSS